MSSRILAIESSGRHGSIALASADGPHLTIVHELPLTTNARTAATLHPAIQQLLSGHGWRPGDLDVVAVTIGPGSFTGLRIGVTAAKTIAYAVDAQVVAVSTLDTLASQANAVGQGQVWSVINAQRGEYFAAEYSSDVELPRDRPAFEILDAVALASRVNNSDTLVGPPSERLADSISQSIRAIPESPSATHVAQLACRRAVRDDFDDLWQLVPEYGRLSAAEEKAIRPE